jgi:hypothetical protein
MAWGRQSSSDLQCVGIGGSLGVDLPRQPVPGAEFAIVGLLFMGSVDSTPDAPGGTLRVDTLSIAQGTADGLRHSAVYLGDEVTALIADGVAREMPREGI